MDQNTVFQKIEQKDQFKSEKNQKNISDYAKKCNKIRCRYQPLTQHAMLTTNAEKWTDSDQKKQQMHVIEQIPHPVPGSSPATAPTVVPTAPATTTVPAPLAHFITVFSMFSCCSFWLR